MRKYLIISIIFFCGCNSENPFISKEQADAILKKDEVKPVEYVAALVDDEVYWFRDFDHDPKKLNVFPGGSKEHIRISHDHAQLAFVLDELNIAVMDTLGHNIKLIPAESGIKQMDWSHDDGTIWALIGNDLEFFGPSLDIPELEKDPEETILSVAITGQNDVFYVVERQTGLGHYTERLEYRGHDGTAKTFPKQEGEIRHMATVRLSRDGEHFVLGYTVANTYEYLAKIEIYPVDGNFPDDTYETDYYYDVVYDSESKYFVSAIADSEFDEYYLIARYTLNDALGPDNNKYKYNYKAYIGEIYVDWK
jgi:hypothetical protein